MGLCSYSDSKTYFEPEDEISDPEVADFQSLRGRFLCLTALFEKLLLLPFALFAKACKTFFRILGVFFSAFFLIATLGASYGIRDFFIQRVTSLARDLADWVLLPFAVLTCFCRLLLACLIHPALFFHS